MLIKHIRCGVSRQPLATIVAISPELIGVAICNERDHFKKSRGIQIARARAEFGVSTKIPTRDVITEDYVVVPLEKVLREECEEMQKRAKKYFKPDYAEAA